MNIISKNKFHQFHKFSVDIFPKMENRREGRFPSQNGHSYFINYQILKEK